MRGLLEAKRKPAQVELSDRGQPSPRLPRPVFLLVFLPAAVIAADAGVPLLAFPTSVLALIGGAFLLGEAAEVVAHRVGEGIGSLVTATLSNLVTLTILGAALLNGDYNVVQAAIVGAILGNILFALGGAMLLGGWNREKQSFGQEAAASNATLLIIASFALLLPALVGRFVGDDAPGIGRDLTVPISLILFGTYVVGLLFSIKTHRHLFNPAQDAEEHAAHRLVERYPVPVLVVSVLMVAMMAETLAASIEPVGHGLGLSELFLGIVVIGVITNSVEIAAAWRLAKRDRMNVTIQIATGSGVQVMLFVVPLLVFISLLLPSGLLSLEFPMAMATAVVMATLLVNIVASDGESTWYEGVLLLALHASVAVVFFFHP